MKKTILTSLILISLTFTLTAQTRFGIIGGPNFANGNVKQNGSSQKGTSITSFHAGIIMDIPMQSSLYFQPQLLFSGKGTKGSGGEAIVHYIEIPFNFIYKYQVGPGKVYGGLGPYAAIAVIGKDKYGSNSVDITFGSGDNADAKRFDAGFNLIMGYEFDSGFLLNFNFSQALTNNLTGSDANVATSHLWYFGISIGYLFGSNHHY